ncbi:unnamed protein product [Blepharisma stoltei]|uniref:GB1/RHD3-type G domain-containing protein n=1 Tax=Blepharisma stoltei TaxID=1481888 RepID=A0AAU9K0W0_9CILI|nr:unnamed protein product [Blepharisma stoltei]
MEKLAASLPLVIHSPNGQLEITSEGSEALSNIKSSISVISMTGPYRTGKSFALNSILGIQGSTFGVGNDVRAFTQGIWMFIEPLSDKTLIYLDIEGFGSTSRSSKDDAKIFALAVLLSSLVIYNSKGVIDEGSINQLVLALYFIECLNLKSASDDTEKLTPNFIWILRDFVLSLEDENGNPITSKMYLERVLREQIKGRSAENIQVGRQLIGQTFENRDCYVLPRPVDSENMLQNMDEIPFNELKEEFKEGIIKIREAIRRSNVKKVKGRSIKGKDLLRLLENYVKFINDGNIPPVPNTWDFIVQREYEEITAHSMLEYQKAKQDIIKQIPIEEQMIKLFIKGQKDIAEGRILGCHLRHEKYMYNALQELMKFYEDELKEILKQNLNSSLNYNLDIIYSLFNPVFQKIELNEYKMNIDVLEADWTYAMDQYEIQARGPGKFIAIAEFSKRNQNSPCARLLGTIFEEMRNQLSQMKIQELFFEQHLRNAEGHKNSKSIIELRSELALNRYRMSQFNEIVKNIQKKVLRQLLEKLNQGEEELDVKMTIESVAMNRQCECAIF